MLLIVGASNGKCLQNVIQTTSPNETVVYERSTGKNLPKLSARNILQLRELNPVRVDVLLYTLGNFMFPGALYRHNDRVGYHRSTLHVPTTLEVVDFVLASINSLQSCLNTVTPTAFVTFTLPPQLPRGHSGVTPCCARGMHYQEACRNIQKVEKSLDRCQVSIIPLRMFLREYLLSKIYKKDNNFKCSLPIPLQRHLTTWTGIETVSRRFCLQREISSCLTSDGVHLLDDCHLFIYRSYLSM